MAKGDYEKARMAIDPILFTISDKKLKVLLHQRDKDPDKGKLELPGGLLLAGETAEMTLKRKLKELLGHSDIFFTQFHTFTKPDRDPRERTVSIGFVALVNGGKIKDESFWHDCSSLPAIAFDHKDIILNARSYLKENINSIIVKQFMPERFPLNKLQEAYELIEETAYDNRNFRKKMIASGIVEETAELEANVSHRPAKLYRFKP